MIEPLQIKAASGRRVVFCASDETRKTTVPPPAVEIGTGSLYEPPPAPPKPPPLPKAAMKKPLGK